MRFSRSGFFLRPANTILVPLMYFFGLRRYSKRVLSSQMTPDSLLAVEYEYPAAWPDCLPKRPWRFGPCLCPAPASTVWHCEHLVLKILAPSAEWGAG